MTRREPGFSKGIDWSLVWLYLLLVAIGIMAIYAVTSEEESLVAGLFSFKTDYSKQFWFLIRLYPDLQLVQTNLGSKQYYNRFDYKSSCFTVCYYNLKKSYFIYLTF